MRIIAGQFKKRVLIAPEGTEITRPTGDRIRESLFNILAPEIHAETNLLDLFSGSGALGIEALSRGARHVVFVESNPVAIKCIEDNIKKCEIHSNKYTIVKNTVERFLSESPIPLLAKQIGIILADPPYATPWYDEALPRIAESGYCNSDCLIVLEMHKDRARHSDAVGEFKLTDIRRYGITKLEFWRNRESSELE